MSSHATPPLHTNAPLYCGVTSFAVFIFDDCLPKCVFLVDRDAVNVNTYAQNITFERNVITSQLL